jgi:hypothetical protein
MCIHLRQDIADLGDFRITEECEPMDYTPVTPVQKDRVEMADVWEFFVSKLRRAFDREKSHSAPQTS